jgi:membrane-associated protease RseP (regulator of RpoE activity)
MSVHDRREPTEDPAPGGPPQAGPHGGELGASAADVARERADMAPVIGSPVAQSVRLAAVVGLLVLVGVAWGLPIVVVIVSILVMIFLHELGHYLAARWSGMKATEFFIGFGPTIWSFRRGETRFGLKAIPAGAYVKIIGMNNLEEVDPADESRTYRQAPFRSRFGVAVAGSAMHFAIALLLLVAQLAFIGRPAEDQWQVGAVTPGSAAEAAGLQPGDQVVSFRGESVGSFRDFRAAVTAAPPGPATVVVERDGGTDQVSVDLRQRIKIIGTIGQDIDLIDSGAGVQVGGVRDGSQAARAGLVEGAPVVAVNGRPVGSLTDVPAAVATSIGGAVAVTTAGAAGDTDHRVDLGSAVATTEPAAFLGIGQEAVLETEPLPAAVFGSFGEFGRIVGVSVVGIGRFLWPPNLYEFATSVTRSGPAESTDVPTPAESAPVSPDAERPISIVGAVMLGGDLTSQNAANLIVFLVALNVFIGVFNLIPLLPFDGGHVAIAVYEKAQEMRRRTRQRHIADVSRLLPLTYGVVIVLIGIGLLAVYLDVTRGVNI